jgi:hypothetical protein
MSTGYTTKSLDSADETRKFDNGYVEVVTAGDHSIGRSHLEPGWRWSDSVKPLAGTELCEVPHVGYCVRGRLHVRMRDGAEFQIRPGDAYVLTDHHDAWVEGEDAFESVEFESYADYAAGS